MNNETESLCYAREPSFFESLLWKIKAWRKRNEPGNFELHARRELKAAGYIPLDQPQEDGPNKWIQESIIELLRVFAKQGHSGFSAPYCIDMFTKLAKFEPLGPLQGTDDEWTDVAEINGSPMWQNKRCSHVFKDETGVYDINGRIFRETDGCCYTSRESRVYITFPYTPSSEYVDVSSEAA